MKFNQFLEHKNRSDM